jgi:hypothetical protein
VGFSVPIINVNVAEEITDDKECLRKSLLIATWSPMMDIADIQVSGISMRHCIQHLEYPTNHCGMERISATNPQDSERNVLA